MNESYKTKGIIIGKRDLGEADKILTVFTENLGKIKIKAKGLKRSLAKMSGHLDMFNYVDLELIKGNTFYIVIGAQSIESFREVKEDLNKIGVMYYFCEILDKVLEEEVAHKNTFFFLLNLLERTKELSVDLLLLTTYFELNVLAYLGFQPEFLVCVGCRDDIAGHSFYFSQERGGILCETCHQNDFYANPISQNAIKLMRLLTTVSYEDILKIKMDDSVPKEVKRINSFFVEHVIGRELKSKSFLLI